jgi:hypothetical protein
MAAVRRGREQRCSTPARAATAPARPDRIRVRRALRWVVAPAFAAAWGWAAVRLLIQPGEAGPLETALAAGGWGLSLLPVHCVPEPADGAATRASRRRRSDAGSARW